MCVDCYCTFGCVQVVLYYTLDSLSLSSAEILAGRNAELKVSFFLLLVCLNAWGKRVGLATRLGGVVATFPGLVASSTAPGQENTKRQKKKSCFPFCSRLAFSRVETYQTAAATDVCATITIYVTLSISLSLCVLCLDVFSRIIGRVAENKLYIVFLLLHPPS